MNIPRLLCWTVPIFLWTGIRLLLFVISLMPGFVRFAWYYFVMADRVSVRYGHDSMRQTLDVYRPPKRRGDDLEGHDNDDNNNNNNNNNNNIQQHSSIPSTIPPPSLPVLVFYTGGAWMIGYKMWGSLLARALTEAGIMVVIPDMRNYPFATVPEMVKDVDASLEWTFQHIGNYGGNPTKVVVVGQSAGGHLSFMAVLDKLRSSLTSSDDNTTALCPANYIESGEEPMPSTPISVRTTWIPSDVKGIVSISSPFHLKAMSDSFERNGLDDHLVNRIFDNDLDKWDPIVTLKELQETEEGQSLLVERLPPIRMYHGTADKTVLHEGSEMFYQQLQTTITDEQRLSFVSYPGWSHTDPILEGPMDANQTLHRDLFQDLHNWTSSEPSTMTWPSNNPVIKNRLCPHFMVQAGRFFNPF